VFGIKFQAERDREKSGFQTHYLYRIGSILCKAVPERRRYSSLRRTSSCQASPSVKKKESSGEMNNFGGRLMWREVGKSPELLSWETPGR